MTDTPWLRMVVCLDCGAESRREEGFFFVVDLPAQGEARRLEGEMLVSPGRET